MVTGTTLPRVDRWLCQKRARLDDVPELILVVGPLGTTNNKGVPGSLRFYEKDDNKIIELCNLTYINIQMYIRKFSYNKSPQKIIPTDYKPPKFILDAKILPIINVQCTRFPQPQNISP